MPVEVRHGGLIPGNLLLAGGRLTSVLDWGGVGVGDPRLPRALLRERRDGMETYGHATPPL